MKKSDLKYGNVVELRDGTRYLYYSFYDNSLIDLNGYFRSCLDAYSDELNHKLKCGLDIMKVYNNYTCSKLLWQRKEKPELTEDEKVVLRNIDKYYNWIARDEDRTLSFHSVKPHKEAYFWSSLEASYVSDLFPNLFQFIKWEDDEPYSIEELLGGEEK